MDDKFDTDELQLSKEQIFQLISVIQKRWAKNKKNNAQYLVGLTAFKTGMYLTPDKTIKKIWHDLVLLTNEMIIYNQLQRMKNEIPNTQDMIKIFERKIESGELLND